MTRNRPEFKAHDDFNFEHKKIGKITREQFIKYIRSSHDHMRKLSQIIQQYDQTIDDYLNEWDGRFESFDEDVKDLLGRWIEDGTMDQIINENLMSIKADKTYVDELHDTTTSQLAQKVDEVKLNINTQNVDYFSEGVLLYSINLSEVSNIEHVQNYIDSLVENGDIQGVTLYDNSVDASKVSYLKQNLNYFNKDRITRGKTISSVGNIQDSANYSVSDYIKIQSGETWWIKEARNVVLFEEDKETISDFIDISPIGSQIIEVVNSGYMRFTLPITENRESYNMVVKGTEPPKDYVPYGFNASNFIKIGEENLQKPLTENSLSFLSSKNKFDKTNHTKNAVLHLNNGEIEIGGDYSAPYGVTDFIPVKKGFLEHTQLRNIVFFNTNKVYNSSIDEPDNDRKVLERDGYIRATFRIKDIDKIMITNNETLEEYQEFGKFYFDEKIKMKEVNLPNPQEKEIVSLHFGDSVTANGNLVPLIEEKTNFTCYNFAVGGTRLIDLTTISNGYQRMNFLDLLRAKVSGDWTTIDEGLSEISDNATANRIQVFKDFNMEEADYLSFMYGTNDIASSHISIGDKDSSDSLTINGALNEVFNIIHTNWPHLKVYVYSPIIRGILPNFEGTSDDYSRNDVSIFDYVNTLEGKAKEYKVPFKNMLQESGINALNFNTFLGDGIHPNSKGDELIADVYSRFMLSH